MFKKLRNNMMLFNMLTVSLVMLTAFAVIYLVTYGNMEQENQRRLQAVSAMFFAPNRTPPAGTTDKNYEPPSAPERFSVDYGVSFVLFVKDGQLMNVNSQLDLDDSVYAEAFDKAGTAASGKLTLADRKWLFTAAPALPQIGGLPVLPGSLQYTRIVFLDITNGVRILRTLMITLTCVALAVLLALLWISHRFAARAIRPIEDSYNKQKQFVADASHELRTPLAIIGANVDAIAASGGETVDSQKEWFGYIRAELKRTGKLVDDLLYLAKSENIKIEDNLPFDLSAVCETVCASMEAVLYDNGKTVKTGIEKGITAIADREKITQVLYILLDNADKYTPQGGKIAVTLGKGGDMAVIKVMNSGAGIAADALPRVFDRFYRSDASRSDEAGGFGLGLSIAKTIVDRSGGTITAESAEGLTVFTVWLKLG
jgi:signal transduction histidine kinase